MNLLKAFQHIHQLRNPLGIKRNWTVLLNRILRKLEIQDEKNEEQPTRNPKSKIDLHNAE